MAYISVKNLFNFFWILTPHLGLCTPQVHILPMHRYFGSALHEHFQVLLQCVHESAYCVVVHKYSYCKLKQNSDSVRRAVDKAFE